MNKLSNKVILQVATTGSSTTRAHCQGLPLTPEEIANETYECWKLGASVVHLHVRDDEGNATMDYEKFRQTMKLIRQRCDIVINMTTAGGFGVSNEDRIRPVELMPEMATMDAGSMNVEDDFVFHNSLKFLRDLGTRTKELHIKPEIEVMDTGMVYTAKQLIDEGYIDVPPHFQIVLGMKNGMAATVDNLIYIKNLLPKGSSWSAFGIEKAHLPILLSCLSLNANVRVGLEDNVYLSGGVKAKNNMDFVVRTKNIIEELGKQIATPEETRKILGLQDYSKIY